jgi:aspartate aminotransferase-like enzyme
MRNKLRLLTPGPTPMPEEVRLALAQDMIHHRKPEFESIMGEVQRGLQTLFGTSQPVLPLACTGSGAMQAAVRNLFNPGEKVLVVEGGKFGRRWSRIAAMHGLQVRRMEVPPGSAAEPAEVETMLEGDRDISGILVQASETSTGVLHPVRELGRISSERDVLLVVDGISAVGISPCPMDSMSVDCLVAGSQKGLMLPPGLSLVACSPKAWNKMERVELRDFYFDLRAEREKSGQGQTAFTSAVSLVRGLKVSLDLILEEGLANVHRKYWALTRMTRAGTQAMGLAPFASEHFTWGLTSIRMPESVDGQAVVGLAAKRYNVYLAGGQGDLKGRIVRIGHMGYVDWGDLLAGLHALNRAIAECGARPGPDGILEEAMRAYESAWEENPPGLE